MDENYSLNDIFYAKEDVIFSLTDPDKRDMLEEVERELIKILYPNGERDYEDFYDVWDVFVELWGTARDTVFERLLDFSVVYPDLTIDIEGRGEEWDDWYVARFHNGKCGIGWATVPDHYTLPMNYNKEFLPV